MDTANMVTAMDTGMVMDMDTGMDTAVTYQMTIQINNQYTEFVPLHYLWYKLCKFTHITTGSCFSSIQKRN